jgi:DNA-binding CsgD family transcriptional regulator
MRQSLESRPAQGVAERIVKEAFRRGQSTDQLTPIEPDRISVTLRQVIRRAGDRPLTVRAAWDLCPDFHNTEFAELIRSDILAPGHRLQVLQPRQWMPRTLADWRPLRGLVGDGAEVRLYPRRLPRMIMLGSETAILQADTRAQGFFLASGPELVDFIRNLYGVLWEQATEISSIAAIDLDPVQSQVLEQLYRGAKDETAAREINVSVRTYRRHVATIMQFLDVKSRFEAGVKVAQLGLVERDAPQPAR